MDRRIEAAIRIVRLESHRELPIRELARRVNLSVWHFDHLFKAETSTSPKQYIRKHKMKLAEEMLSESFLSVKEVAANLGFGDRSHFSRDFSKVNGQSPSAVSGRRKGNSTTKPALAENR